MRRIIGFFGLVLIFTNCVTLFHSARVLEPGEYETGFNCNLGTTFADTPEKTMIPFTSPFFSFFGRQGLSFGFNTGGVIGFPHGNLFITKSLIKESNKIPSVSITAEINGIYTLIHNEFGIFASIDLHKQISSIWFNPSLRFRFGIRNGEDWGWPSLEGNNAEDISIFESNIFISNEFHGMLSEDILMPYFSITFPSNESFKINDPLVYEVDFGITFFLRMLN